MDPLEKKIRELYLQKKREDEKSIPSFDTFRGKPGRLGDVRNSYFFLKMAAAVVLLAVAGPYYFYSSRRTAKETMCIYLVNINQNLSTQSLLDKNAGSGYIWNWKAPTDKLLNDANKSLTTN
jgi:hypothetical protein